jgi:hypothetical protein
MFRLCPIPFLNNALVAYLLFGTRGSVCQAVIYSNLEG